jgi:hypothetical protein
MLKDHRKQKHSDTPAKGLRVKVYSISEPLAREKKDEAFINACRYGAVQSLRVCALLWETSWPPMELGLQDIPNSKHQCWSTRHSGMAGGFSGCSNVQLMHTAFFVCDFQADIWDHESVPFATPDVTRGVYRMTFTLARQSHEVYSGCKTTEIQRRTAKAEGDTNSHSGRSRGERRLQLTCCRVP